MAVRRKDREMMYRVKEVIITSSEGQQGDHGGEEENLQGLDALTVDINQAVGRHPSSPRFPLLEYGAQGLPKAGGRRLAGGRRIKGLRLLLGKLRQQCHTGRCHPQQKIPLPCLYEHCALLPPQDQPGQSLETACPAGRSKPAQPPSARHIFGK